MLWYEAAHALQDKPLSLCYAISKYFLACFEI